MLRNKPILFMVLSFLILCGATAADKYFSERKSYREAIAAIEISDLDISAVPDGVYYGFADAVWVNATVQVTVKNGMITAIALEHDHSRGQDAEVIPDRVIAAQALQVDNVSGATASAQVILKAIENALLLARE